MVAHFERFCLFVYFKDKNKLKWDNLKCGAEKYVQRREALVAARLYQPVFNQFLYFVFFIFNFVFCIFCIILAGLRRWLGRLRTNCINLLQQQIYAQKDSELNVFSKFFCASCGVSRVYKSHKNIVQWGGSQVVIWGRRDNSKSGNYGCLGTGYSATCENCSLSFTFSTLRFFNVKNKWNTVEMSLL